MQSGTNKEDEVNQVMSAKVSKYAGGDLEVLGGAHSYINGAKFTSLSLKYKGGKFSMLFFLPQKKGMKKFTEKALVDPKFFGKPIVPNIINGEEVFSSTDKYHEMYDKCTGEVKCLVPVSTQEEMESAVECSKEAFKTWSKVSPFRRSKFMFQFAELLRENKERLANTVVEDLGKVMADAHAGVHRGVEIAEFACGIPSLVMGETLHTIHNSMDLATYKQPIGVTASICAFNFPHMVPMWFVPLAIATGNTHILKPSRSVPLSSNLIAEIAYEAGLPNGILNVIHGGREAVDFICENKEIQAVSFVGGDVAGMHVVEKCAATGKRVQANLGAKNHGVILPDADKDVSIMAVASAAFGAAGQRCMALPTTVLVGETKEWKDDIVACASTFKCGPGFDPESHFGPVVTKESMENIYQLIQNAENEGCQILLDGRDYVVPGYEGGYYVGPTVIAGVETHMEIYKEEVFGPVMLLMERDTIDDAIQLINENEYGNGTGIFTKSGAAARKFQFGVDVGQVGINVPIPVPLPVMSFTGWKQSMYGDLHVYGKQGVNFYTRTKTVTSLWKNDEVAGREIAFPTFDD